MTPANLFRAAGAAGVAAGLIFIGVQVNHPHLDAVSISTTDVIVRNALKLLMAVLALVGISGIYLFQVRRLGLLGMVGYVLLATGFVCLVGTQYVAAFVLPSVARSSPAYVNDVISVATGGTATGDVGLMRPVLAITGVAYLLGGLIFGIALLRAGVLARWAAALLAVGAVATVAIGVVPQYERLLAIPTGVALAGLGVSLWRAQRAPAAPRPRPVSSQLEPIGAR